MLKYIFKNLKSQFTKQGVISLLLVINIIVSALVICFSYGLYQHYNIVIDKGDKQPTSLMLYGNPDYITYDERGVPFSGVTFQNVIDLAKSLPDETAQKLNFLIKTPLEADVFDIGYGAFTFYFVCEDGEINSPHVMFPEGAYPNGEKVAMVSTEQLEDHFGPTFQMFNGLEVSSIPLSADDKEIIVDGEEYEVVIFGGVDAGSIPYIPITSVNPSTLIRYAQSYVMIIYIDVRLTTADYNNIEQAVENIMGDVAYLEKPEITDITETYYYKTIIIISVIIAILAAINMAILYRYILEKRSSELAIFRICGCSKAKAVMSYLIECMLINAPLFALTQLCYHKLIMPKLSGLFPHMQGAYSFKLYAAIFGIYVVASLIVMLIMIVATIRKHSLVEQKNSSKAKTRFGIMKLFEVVQLSIVIAIIICLVSAILSRYTYYDPFADVIEGQGYMCVAEPSMLDIEKFNQDFEQYELLPTSAFGFGMEEGKMHGGYAYSDKLATMYKPQMKDGVWLSETDITHENSGFIPIVVTANSWYKVGDEIVESYATAFNEHGVPLDFKTIKYKVIGIVEDRERIVSCDELKNKAEDFNDIYGIFDSEYRAEPFAFALQNDVKSGFGADKSPVSGVQFILCNDASEEEYEALGERLKMYSGALRVTPLSEIHKNSMEYIYKQMYTLFPIALCIFILTVISAVSINAIYTKRQLRNYAIFYICGARWRTCALKSLKDSTITCAVASALCALILFIGKQNFLKETVISFGIWHAVICVAVIALYLLLSMIMPIAIIGSSQPKDVLKEE